MRGNEKNDGQVVGWLSLDFQFIEKVSPSLDLIFLLEYRQQIFQR